MTNPQTKSKHVRVRRGFLIVVMAVLAALAVLAGLYGWLYVRGRQSLLGSGGSISTPSTLVDSDDGDLVVYNGISYRYNENVTAILVMGIDKTDIQAQGVYGQNGQADTLFLAALDTITGAMHIVPISRETMVDINQYAVDGTYIGVKNTQLCLAYAYAASGEDGCRNVARSVSRLLYGVPINNYVAIDMDGVKAITNTVGGVPVTALEDVRNENGDRIIKKGQKVTLKGDTALAYIRDRGTDAQANNHRMQRQKQFFTAFLARTAQKLQENVGRLPGYYNTVSPYVVTNVTLSQVTYLVGRTLSNGGWQSPVYHTITGKTVMGKKHVEFYANSLSAYEAVLASFYKPVKWGLPIGPRRFAQEIPPAWQINF